MTDIEMRSLLQRLVQWVDELPSKVAWTGEQTLRDFVIPATGIAEDARALLAQPAPEGEHLCVRPPNARGFHKPVCEEFQGDAQFCPFCGGRVVDAQPAPRWPEMSSGGVTGKADPNIQAFNAEAQPAPEGEALDPRTEYERFIVGWVAQHAPEVSERAGAAYREATSRPTPPAARVEALDFETAVLRLERAVRRMEACPEGDPYERWADYETARAAVFAAYRPLPRAEAAPERCEDDFHDELCDCNQTRPHLSRAKPAPEGRNPVDSIDTSEPPDHEDFLEVQRFARASVKRLRESRRKPTPPAASVEAMGVVEAMPPVEQFITRLCAKDYNGFEERKADVRKVVTDFLAASRPLPRAEAEAMVDRVLVASSEWERLGGIDYHREFDFHRAALLRVLTGEGT